MELGEYVAEGLEVQVKLEQSRITGIIFFVHNIGDLYEHNKNHYYARRQSSESSRS